MKYQEFLNFLQNKGKDPSRLIFEDELTGIHNRRFLLNYFQSKISWDALKDNPLSLVMMDVDHFKKINDSFGHLAGDQALVWLAGLLKDVAGEEGLAVRYAGDEFIILIPHGKKQAALKMGEHLLQHIRETPLTLDKVDESLHITLSIGVASAPEDGHTGKTLIQMADAALYYAKKAGRDRLANAGEIDPQDVFAKTVLHQIEGEKTTGHRLQLSQVVKSFQNFNQGQNQFLIIEGDSGMGKSTFLESVRQELVLSEMMWQVKVNGTPQESFRPYYLMSNILVELLSNREDKGIGIFESLSIKETTYLARILPQLEGEEEVPLDEDEKAQREGIFNTLLYFVPKILDFKPLILYIDDLQFADEATLLLLRRLMLLRELKLFICCTSTPIEPLKSGAQEVPLGQFYESYHRELGICKIPLTPLTASDIADHLQKVFPQVSLPKNFEKDLAQITQGNPLFLSEILRKLALDQKIPLMDQQRVIEPLEKGYLPESLEEMVSQKITSLDEESRQLLYRAATFGEDVSLSFLTGSSEEMEAKILEFVEQAATLGLLRSDFQINDETIRFLGKRILETIYGAIQPDHKQELHERIGDYQETLYQQRLLLSASTSAYHFKRSANQEKSRDYEEYLEKDAHETFNSLEAKQYSGERRKRRTSELPPPGVSLDPSSLAKIPNVIRCLLTTVRHIKLYPIGSKAVVSANLQLKEAIDLILATNENLAIFHINQALMVNGQKIDVSEFKWMAGELLKFMMNVELKGVIFRRGLSRGELEVLVEAFSRPKPKMIDRDFWQRFSSEQHLEHIELKQVQYTLMVDSEVEAKSRETPRGADLAPAPKVSYRLLAREQKLDQEDLGRIPEIIRCLLNAAKNIKIYPLASKAISDSIQQLMETLRSIFKKKPILTLAQVSHSLLVNGIRVETSEMGTLADSFLKFLDSISLTSLTFLDSLSDQELKTFIGALGELPSAGLDSEFWARFSDDQGFTGILFDKILYETWVTPTLADSDQVQPSEEPSEEFGEGQMVEPVSEELLDSFLKEMPGQVNDLFAKGKEKQILQMMRQLFLGFQNRQPQTREKIIGSCLRLLGSLSLAFQHRFTKVLADPVLAVFSEERDPIILNEIAFLLHRMATYPIQFGDYPLASQILMHLHSRHQKLIDAEDPYALRLAKILDRNLETTIRKLLVKDLKSSETSRQQGAAQLLGNLGRNTIPLLIDIIKKEDDLRVREIAASLLGEMGQEAAGLLKRELVVEGTSEGRLRILEVIDTVASDLKTELVFAFRDETPEVRQAAFQLAERLNDSGVVELLLDYARSRDAGLAVEAINCLGKLKPLAAVEVLVPILNTSNDKKRLISCCHALGQIGNPASIEPLAKILTRKGSFFRRKRKRAQVRAAAAFALGQISHSRAAEVLAAFVDDRNPQVREIARALVKFANSPATKEE